MDNLVSSIFLLITAPHLSIYLMCTPCQSGGYFFTTHAGRVRICSITLPKLLHGVEKRAMVSYNIRKFEDFVSRLKVLPYDTCSLSTMEMLERI